MTDPDRIEVELMKACADSHGKDHRFVSTIVTYVRPYTSSMILRSVYR